MCKDYLRTPRFSSTFIFFPSKSNGHRPTAFRHQKLLRCELEMCGVGTAVCKHDSSPKRKEGAHAVQLKGQTLTPQKQDLDAL